MQKILLLFILVCGSVWTINAQEQGIYRHYSIYPTLINPGATGINEGQHEFLGNMINTWSGAPGTPIGYTFGYSGSFGQNVGLGLQLMNESHAAINRFKAAINYAYKVKFDDAFFSVGVSTEFQQKKLKSSVLDDPSIDPTDPYLQAANEGIKYFDFGLGIHARINEKFNFGIALPNMVHTFIDKPSILSNEETKFLGNFVGYVSNRFDIADFDFDLEPGVAIRKVSEGDGKAPLLGDVNLTGYFLDNKLIGGVSYHFGAEQSGGGILLGILLNKVGIYYSFDIYTGDYQPYNNGKHEVTVGFTLNKKPADSSK
ncbi:MAG: PorP/SprF family type IX secretion system membrane protein [Saprospiraceae bacterium]|jgi:type IX secretion system PorP/SprF family membrane protein|nr:PorP/SprF family type IX secretion system membrane protein [Saprospiraceae bacterium]